MRSFFIFTLFCFIHLLAQAQTIQLKTQAQVNAMANGSSSIHSLQIGSALDTELSDITDLSPLLGIHTLYGAGLVVVNNPHLKSLHGLENISQMQGLIWILKNDSLVNLQGLPTTYSIGDTYEDYRNISIHENASLISLDGFPFVPEIYFLSVRDNPNLENIEALIKYKKLVKGFSIGGAKITSLAGLDSLMFVGNSCGIRHTAITNLQHLNNLSHIGKDFTLGNNPNLFNLQGIGSIKKLSTLRIDNCDALTSFSGLDSLKTIKKLLIKDCDSLVSVQGLESVDSIKNIEINNNAALFSLKGLENVNYVSSLEIKDCPNLNNFDQLNTTVNFYTVENCDNLLHINNTHGINKISIKNNPRLKNYGPFPNVIPFNSQNIEITLNDSLASVEGLLGLERVTDDLMLYENPKLNSLHGLDSLTYTGTISFGATNIQSLKPLKKLDSIDFKLSIRHDIGKINTLEGLENLSNIQYGFRAYNKNLKDISALLVSPTYSGYTFTIAYCDSLNTTLHIDNINAPDEISLYNNLSIKNITGFSNIDSLHQGLRISNNKNLQTITGLVNLKHVKTIGAIHTNPNLTDISGLCHLFTEGTIAGTIDIHDNAAGFNSQQEIIDWCMTPTIDLPTWDAIAVYPNPTADAFFVDVPMDLIQVGMMVDLVGISGVSHFSARIKDSVSSIPVGDLAPGLYFLRIVFDERLVQVKKVLVER